MTYLLALLSAALYYYLRRPLPAVAVECVFTARGKPMSTDLKPMSTDLTNIEYDAPVTLRVSGADRNGRPAALPGPVAVTHGPTDAVTVAPTADPLVFTVSAAGPASDTVVVSCAGLPAVSAALTFTPLPAVKLVADFEAGPVPA